MNTRSDGRASERIPAVLPATARRPRAIAQHLLRLENVAVLVDGYNFVFTLWSDSKDDIGAARRRLERRLHQLVARDSLDVTVVWDGLQDADAVPLRRRHHRAADGGASVVFSPVGYEADDTIALSCELLPSARPVVVVTFDRELQRRVGRTGANVITPNTLLQLLPMPPIDDEQALRILDDRREALQKLLLGIDPATALNHAVADGTLREIVPEVPALREISDAGCRHSDALTHTIAVVERTPQDFLVRFAALLQDIGKPSPARDEAATRHFAFTRLLGHDWQLIG